MDSIVYTPSEVSKLLRIRLAMVYELIKNGEIPAIRIGKNYKIPKDAFNQWLTMRTVGQMEKRISNVQDRTGESIVRQDTDRV